MMTHAETMIINNMTNVIKNLEQSKSVCDIIDDLNELILTLRGRNHDIMNEAITVTPVQIKTDTKPKAEPVQKQTKAEPVQKQTKAETVTVPAAAGPSRPVAPRPEPVQKNQAPTKAPAPGRGKVECRCGLMVCNAAMSRHEKGTKHKEAMAKKEKTELKQAEGQTLGVSDMDLADIETYMKIMLPYLDKKVRGLGGL